MVRARFSNCDLMAKNDLAFCIHDMTGLSCPPLATSNVVYLRFHGTAAGYSGKYNHAQLHGWAKRILDFLNKGAEVYVYFNNDAFGYALENAQELQRLIDTRLA